MEKDEEGYKKEKEALQLIGSQMNLSSRSNHSFVSPQVHNHRPLSAVACYEFQPENKTNALRPKSAGTLNSHSIQHNVLQYSFSSQHSDTGMHDTLSKFTDSSSKLLHSLLNSTNCSTKKNFCQNLHTKSERNFDNFLQLKGNQHYKKYYTSEPNLNAKESINNFEIQPWLPDVEEKIVRFLETQYEEPKLEKHRKEDHNKHYCSVHGRPIQHVCHRREFEKRDLLHTSENETGHVLREGDGEDKQNNVQINNDKLNLKNENDKKNMVGTLQEDIFKRFKSCKSAQVKLESFDEMSEKSYLAEKETFIEENEKFDLETKCTNKLAENDHEEKEGKTKKDSICEGIDLNLSTYEEIAQLLQTLDEDTDSLNTDNKISSEEENMPDSETMDKTVDQLSAVYSYLKEVEKEETGFSSQKNSNEGVFKSFQSPRLEELLNKNSVELAHEVLSLRIQIEDQKKGIKLLRDKLAEMKEVKKKSELEHQEALQKANTEAETLVRRHQKFIKQLLNEKKNLNETVSKLVQDLKLGEEKHKKNMKALEEKHSMEIKRAKEIQAAADKIKREKWMESKTQKIKEMTVKGLEPELSRMAMRQQEEMTELRNLHRAELEALELRAARRTSELMDQLRTELTKEKEHAIARETTTLRTSMEKEFEEERNKLQTQLQMIKERLRKEETKLVNQELEFQQRLMDQKRDAEKDVQRIVRDHQEQLEEIKRRHLIEIKTLKESLEAEKEVWITNYKKQQANQFSEKEGELHQRYKKERDRDIEMIIEMLEKESTKAQKELNAAAENKLKRLREKLEDEIKEVEASETALKQKLSETKSQVLEKEDCITQLKTQIRQYQTEMEFLRKSCEQMTAEKANLREVVKKEFEKSINEAFREKENLEKEILVLKEINLKELSKKDQLNLQAKEDMQKELTRVYSRVKTAISKKEKTIQLLREEIKTINQRCEHLEMLLDRQRRNLLLQ